MVPPMSSLQALGAEIGKRLGHLLPSFKGQDAFDRAPPRVAPASRDHGMVSP